MRLLMFMLAAVWLAATAYPNTHDAIPNDGIDDTPAIQTALDAAAETPGAVVRLGSGDYDISGTLYVPGQTTLQGTYQGPGRRAGTTLLATGHKGERGGDGCVVLRDGMAALSNVTIEYPEQSAEATVPTPYPYAIRGGHSSRIEDVFLYNAYQGIDLDGAHANRVRDIWGEPLRVGINVDHCYDISRIENVHFWPYFTNGKPLRDWVQAHGVAFQFGRSDWQYCLNTFCYGYHTGYRFYHTEGVPRKNYPAGATNGNFVGIGADRAVIGIDVEDAFDIGVSITNGLFAPFGAEESWGVLLRESNTGNLTLTNCNFWAVTNAVAEVRSGSLTLSACTVKEWSLLKKDAPCFRVCGGRLNVHGCTFNAGGLVLEAREGVEQVSFTANMAPDVMRMKAETTANIIKGLNSPPVTWTDSDVPEAKRSKE